FKKSAEKNHLDAEIQLGSMYEAGAGVAKDPVQAAHWYQKAFEQGNVPMAARLGQLYENTKDMPQAAVWYQKAATQGNVDAQIRLGVMHYLGEGVAKDPAQTAL